MTPYEPLSSSLDPRVCTSHASSLLTGEGHPGEARPGPPAPWWTACPSEQQLGESLPGCSVSHKGQKLGRTLLQALCWRWGGPEDLRGHGLEGLTVAAPASWRGSLGPEPQRAGGLCALARPRLKEEEHGLLPPPMRRPARTGSSWHLSQGGEGTGHLPRVTVPGTPSALRGGSTTCVSWREILGGEGSHLGDIFCMLEYTYAYIYFRIRERERCFLEANVFLGPGSRDCVDRHA